jgi:hypothetical protein
MTPSVTVPRPSSVGYFCDAEEVRRVLVNFAVWLDRYGESSWDFQSVYAGAIGGRAKAFYYRHRLIGTAAVAPMVFCEALLPSARRLFHHRMRFPIADAHYAMGFAFLYQATANPAYLQRAIHFLEVLEKTRCRQFKDYCWGYPFDWVWHGGTIKKQTPLITTTPYVYEAFLQILEIVEDTLASSPPSSGHRAWLSDLCPPSLRDQWRQILQSIARHAARDINDSKTSETASSCSYTPGLPGVVINAAAYRAFLLTSASQLMAEEEYWSIAERNLNFVLENQNPDGSWYYAMDGVRDFVDHFHTCFVMKALAKIHSITGNEGCATALAKGLNYYLKHLVAADGLPKPFSKAPRLTIYKREVYDCAECINLCLLLRDRFPKLQITLERVIQGVLDEWVKPDGSFRSRRLYWGWDNVPMHRWGQSQMFRSLALYLKQARRAPSEEQPLTTAPARQPSTLSSRSL